MQGTVQEITTTKAGKPRVKVNGEWYSVKGVIGMFTGQSIDFDASSWDYQGKTYHGIDKWGPVPGSSVQPMPSAPPQATNGHAPSLALTGDELRFISNVVGSAITSKAIEDPVDLIAWAKGAQAALKSLAGDF